MRRESGQATVESAALVLLVALVLGGAVAAVSSRAEGDHGLGPALAKRIAKAPRALAGAASPRSPAPAAAPRGPSSLAAPRSAAPRRPDLVAVPQRRGALAPKPRAPARPPRSRAIDAFRRLRGLTRIAQRAWIVCLGYRRWRYELAHPRAPTQPLPLGDALAIANDCLNPYSFLLQG
jgi:hypothetical protein